ncbi:uncharacterized protein OCT59_016665 [Rhizophagus irregularis]|uniref:Uncharacterized protein n=4 Tax=Rhizophagus irregularis TaxID=588596 RepID=A0A916EEB7_9GLOM|nr:hypothetical protein RirG_237300 [Rhizophagus irregularis DAOM 197198w]UZO24362.1 hypothetical protein OCT59_016665 [Rhizophagus irregularis]CAB5189544.1 unnamed protein product [Rhizophagus irregularis]CAB5380943.1 unnamed protein product [Rhizophagus irregularis]
MKLINKIKIKLLSASRFLQNNYYYTNLTILNHHQQIDILKRSYNDYNFYNDYNLFKRKRFSSITNENSIKENEINDLTTLNEDELLWKLKLYLFTKKDVEDYWKILQVYMKDIRDMRDTRDTRDMRKIDMSSVKDIRDMRDMRDTKDTTHTNDIKNTTHTKDIKDTTHNRDIKGDKRDDDLFPSNISNISNSNDKSLSMKYIALIFTKFFKDDKDDQKSVLFWEMLKKSNIKLNSNCYNIILQNSYSSNYFTLNLKNIFDEMKLLNYKPTIFTLKIMISNFSKLGKMIHVKKFYQIYLKLNYKKKSKEIFNSLIIGNLLINNLTSVYHQFRTMDKSNLKPSKFHIDQFINSCSSINNINNNNNNFDYLKWTFEKYYLKGDFNITTEIFNLVLLSCSNQNQRKLSNHYFYEMIKKKNLKPNELTFQYLIISHIGNDGVGSSGSSGSSSGSRGPHESHGSHRSHASRESRGSRGPRESHKRKENFLEILRESIDFYKLMKRKFLLKPTEITSFILVNGIVYQDKLLSNGELLPLTIVDVLPELSHELLDNLQFKINPEINKKVTNKYLQSLFSTLLKYNYTNEAENVYKTIHSRKQG